MESRVKFFVHTELPKLGFDDDFFIGEESDTPPALKQRLARASKSKSGAPGRADILAYSAKRNTILVVECKESVSSHGDINSDDIKNKAVPGAIHYMKALWEQGAARNGEYIYGLAISGVESTKRRVSYYGCCNAQVGSHFVVKELYDGSELQTLSYLEEKIWSFRGVAGAAVIESHGVETVSLPFPYLLEFEIAREWQRGITNAHVDEIFNELAPYYRKDELKIMGVLQFIWYRRQYHLIDGQHRFEAYRRLWLERGKFFTVVIQVMKVENQEDLKKYYRWHYNALEATEEEKTAEAKTNWAYDLAHELIQLIRNEYKSGAGKSMVNGSTAPPYITEGTYKSDLTKYFEENGEVYRTKRALELLEVVKSKNEALGKNLPTKQKGGSTEPYKQAVIEKANNGRCWLGLVKAEVWFDNGGVDKI